MKREITIYTTTDYEQFNRLKGNRDVTNKRVSIIKESIKSVGYISNPIIVNEGLEVIDGQGRLEALRQLGMPVEFRIVKGLGINECRAMNLKPTGWSISDFVKSYAEYGNENYIRFKNIADKHGFGYTLAYALAKNNVYGGGAVQGDLRDGTLYLDEQTALKLDDILTYLEEFKEVQGKVGGRKELFFGAIGWIALQDGVDRERLRVSVIQQSNSISPAAQTEPTLKELSEVYNKGYSRNNRRYFDYEWKTREAA